MIDPFFDPRLVAIRQEMKAACDARAAAKSRAERQTAQGAYHDAGRRHRALYHSLAPAMRAAWERAGART